MLCKWVFIIKNIIFTLWICYVYKTHFEYHVKVKQAWLCMNSTSSIYMHENSTQLVLILDTYFRISWSLCAIQVEKQHFLDMFRLIWNFPYHCLLSIFKWNCAYVANKKLVAIHLEFPFLLKIRQLKTKFTGLTLSNTNTLFEWFLHYAYS
jgi:hypothetical protein